jgi:hypothetical protein
MKKLSTLLLTTILASAPSFADWDSETASVKSSNSDFVAIIDKSTLDEINIFFMHADESCKSYGNASNASNHNFNGVMVKFAKQCAGNGFVSYFPRTLKGRDFIVNEFKIKRAVNLEGIIFSAKGFTKAYELFKFESTAI